MKKFFQRYKKENISRSRFNIEWIGLSLLLIAILFAIFYFQKKAEVVAYREKIQTSEMSVVMLQEGLIESKMDGVVNDLEYVATMCSFSRLLNSKDDLEHKIYKDEFQEELKRFIKVHSQYDQIRYIDIDGKERVRVNFDGNKIDIVDESRLQDKSNRYYFKDSINLEKNQVYQSVLNLNVENGEIEYPEKPMIRFAKTVYDENENKMGIVIINYNAKVMLKSFEDMSKGSAGKSFLLNTGGYSLAGDSDDKFDFMYHKNSEKSLKNIYAPLWEKIIAISPSDGIVQRYGRNGLMTFTEVNRPPNIILNERWFILTGITKEEDKLCTKDSIFKIILLEYLDQKMYFIACIILSYFIILSYTLYRKNIKNISDMATYDKLTGAYSRSRGFEIVKMDMEFAVKNKRDYSVCFIDLNDLKKVNDKYGHEMGDLYLKDSVNMIKSRLNYRENIVRMGGDEFLVGVFKSKEEIDFGWKCLIEDAKSYNEKNDYPFEISLSHGVASIDEKEVKSLDDMINIADKRMYVEKRAMKEGIRRS